MSEINRVFNGKMSLDVSPYRVQPNDYIEALNITKDAQGQARDNVVSNIVGNTLVSYTLPAGQNKCIGRFEDSYRNRIYYFVWNSAGYNLWLFWDAGENTITKLIEDLTDTNNVPVLDFDPSKRINHVDIIYRDESEGDMVFWTDGNVSPRKANVKKIIDGDYSVIKAAFIEVAKMPFLSSPTAAYGSDTERNANSLRRKLFQFTARPVYDDYEKATFSAYSKIPLPIGYYGSDNDLDSTKNNYITITVETGDENAIAIEIAMRNNINNAWGDFVLIASLNKEQLGIPNNQSYSFIFYNDGVYPPIDVLESLQLYDWVPQKAYTQCLGNGTTPIYGAITENYNNYPINDLDVTLSATNVTNVPPDSDPPQLTYESLGGDTYVFTPSGNVTEGTYYKVLVYMDANPGPINGVGVLSEYTSLPGDTLTDVVTGLYTSTSGFYTVTNNGDSYTVTLGANSIIMNIEVIAGASGGEISTEKTWLWSSNYIFGLVYVDEQNRDMPGVTTYTSQNATDNDFLVTTPDFSLDGTSVQTPVIDATINHTPPAGSKAFYWVRRRMTYGNPVMYITCNVIEESGYYYLCLANIDLYKEENSQFIYSSAPVTTESRIQILAGVTAGDYNGDVWTQDYQILGVVTKTITPGGTSPDDDRPFIKIKVPDSAPSPAYTENMLVMIYEPLLNPTSEADSVYWEWGEGYEVYELQTLNYTGASGAFTVGETVTGATSGATGEVFFDSGALMYVENVEGQFDEGEVITGGTSLSTATITTITSQLYHRGGDQDQTPFQEAEYTWEEGDMYFHQRNMYTEILGDPPYDDATLDIMDSNFSDFFDSAVNDNGRAQAIEVDARQQYNPVLVRFGGEFQSGTNINQTNNFKFDNFDEYDRGFGDIRKMFINKRLMYVFQIFDIGIVPIFTQIVRDTTGNPLEANSDQLLNKIAYPYQGKFGIGDVPESFAFGKGGLYNGGMYGVDSNKGVVWRLSQDGITAISILYECNAFFVENTAAYGKELDNGYAAQGEVYSGNPTIYGAFDGFTNKYVVSLEEINRYDSGGNLIFHQDPYTLSFLETRNSQEGFEGFYSAHPEMIGCLNSLLVMWKDGAFWTHNSGTFCNFFGTQYDATITAVFNDSPLEKKTFMALAEVANLKWECVEMTTDTYSYGTTPQNTTLLNGELVRLEGTWHSSIKRDINSRGRKVNGDYMKGKYIIVKFKASDPTVFSLLNIATVKYATSPQSI